MKRIVLNRWLLDLISEYRWMNFPDIPVIWEDGFPRIISNTEEILGMDKKKLMSWFSVDEKEKYHYIRNLDDIKASDLYIVRVESIYIIPDPIWKDQGYLDNLTIRIWKNQASPKASL